MDKVRIGAIALALGLAPAGCTAAVFVCGTDTQCEGGRCEADGYCSFPDLDCPSGWRYGSGAPRPMSSACVAEQPSETSGGTGSTSTTSSSSTTLDDSTSTTMSVSASESTTAVDTATSTSDSTMTGSSDSTAGGGASTGSTVMGDFFDDFERPDGNQIGNGWIEKRPTTWALDQGSVVFESDALNYQDNIVYRPENEDVLDTEVSIDFTLLTWDSNTHPQVHARLQHDDLDVPGSVTCYILFITSGPVLSITRQIAGTFDGQWSVPLTNPLQEGDTYRLELRVTGQGPVELQGVLLHRLNGNFVEDTTIVRSDSDANMVTGAGSVGFSGSVSPEHYTYDNFSRIDLGTN